MRSTRSIRSLIISNRTNVVVIVIVLILLFTKTFQFFSEIASKATQSSMQPLPRPKLENTPSRSSLQDEVVRYIRANHITPPSSSNIPYDLSDSYESYAEHDQYHADILKIVFKHCSTPGIFVEAGALDGQYLSHTLDLEKDWNWTGLLVEASPSKVKQLKSKNRRSWIADVCLSDQLNSTLDFITKKVQDEAWKRGNGMIDLQSENFKLKRFPGLHEYMSEGKVDCFSLDSILDAVNITRVDLFVFDIEGFEFQVLQSFPFDRIPITVLAVEHWIMPNSERFQLLKLMFTQGYDLVYESVSDYIFVNLEK